MALEEAEDVFGATAILQLAVLGVLAYLAYKFYKLFIVQTNCGPNKDQPCCRTSDVNTSACVDASGNVCGWGSFLSFQCFSPAGSQAAVDTARQSSSVWGGLGSIFSPEPTTPAAPVAGTLPMQTTLGTAPTVGLPSGYNPDTGTIGSGASGVPTAGVPDLPPPSPLAPTCTDVITGNTYAC
jgi:hypothetical protein